MLAIEVRTENGEDHCNPKKEIFFPRYKVDFTKGSSILDNSRFVYIPERLNELEYRKFPDCAYKEIYLRLIYSE